MDVKNTKIISALWKVFESIKDELFYYGLQPYEYSDNCFCIYVDLKKIKCDSVVKKHNINKFNIKSVFLYNKFILQLTTLNNNKKNATLNINSNFPMKEILIIIFKLIGIDIFDRYKDYIPLNMKININQISNSMKKHENYEEYKKNLKTLDEHIIIINKNMEWLEKNIIDIIYNETEFNELLLKEKKFKEKLSDIEIEENTFLKDTFIMKLKTQTLVTNIHDEINNDKNNKQKILKEKIEIFNNLLKTINETLDKNKKFDEMYKIQLRKKEIKDFFEYMKIEMCNIIDYNILLNENFIIETINFEKTLFPDIFKFEIIKSEIFENVDTCNKTYIYMSTKVEEYLNKFKKFKEQIDNYLTYINNNM